MCALIPQTKMDCPPRSVCDNITLAQAMETLNATQKEMQNSDALNDLSILGNSDSLFDILLGGAQEKPKCPEKTPKPTIQIIPNKATIHYSSNYKQGDQLPEGIQFPYGAAGITLSSVIPYRMSIDVGETQSCYYTKKIKLYVGYRSIPVYIDKRYKRGTCEYNKIYEHEKQHAMWAIDAATFFVPDLKRVLEKAIKTKQTSAPKSATTPQGWVSHQKAVFLPAALPVLSHMQKKIKEKNSAMDTPENYLREAEEILRDCYLKPLHAL